MSTKASSFVVLVTSSLARSISRCDMGVARLSEETSGDVDVLLLHPDGVSHNNLLPRVLALLRGPGGLVTADLSVGGNDRRGEADKDKGLGGLTEEHRGVRAFKGVFRFTTFRLGRPSRIALRAGGVLLHGRGYPERPARVDARRRLR